MPFDKHCQYHVSTFIKGCYLPQRLSEADITADITADTSNSLTLMA